MADEVYVVDPGTGDTVGRTTFADEVTDVEALTHGPDGEVWVGDIGDNGGDRSGIRVHRIERPTDGDRRVAYVCALAYVDPSGEEHVVEGRCEGELTADPRGSGGFGYDPAFVPDDRDDGRTMAELAPEEKDAISHRGRAARSLREWLDRLPEPQRELEEARALRDVAGLEDKAGALLFLLGWPHPQVAARLVMEHHDAMVGQSCTTFNTAAMLLEDSAPLAAMLLYRRGAFCRFSTGLGLLDSKPQIARRVVVLPTEEGPNSAKKLPSATSRSSPSSAVVAP